MFDNTLLTGVLATLVSFVLGYTLAKAPRSGSKKSSDADTDDATENVFADIGDEFKMVLVVRTDLKMTKGKIGAQCGHAAVGAFESAMKKTPGAVRKWQHSGQAKIALKVDNETEMMEIYRTARANNLNCCLIRDAGRTQIEPNSKTVLAVGPAPNAAVDSVTGHLKLL
ncbi:probable peptidyl-tRNA hydrolase 2 [Anopheles bellator]|uniref:probable peptidyl-tRNA hydrolase 2 n=1 Tax=Anopheles bellator TaxID=139047 RepID=UPI00264726AB|nr:probable peptidyl-tRNA hydrolase 2 [Anopheles bellator]